MPKNCNLMAFLLPSFRYATWLRPMQGDGFVEQQSAACNVCPRGAAGTPGHMAPGCGEGDSYVMTPANVAVFGGKDIRFDSCTFQHLGAYGSGASKGSQRVSWANCTFRDLSGGAIMLGGLDTCDETDTGAWDKDFSIADCKITNLPVEYTGATAVFFGYVENATLEHNWMENMTYSAMTIGWGWGRTACGRGNNHVRANKIVNPLRTRCCDGGEVYTLGPQPGSTIERNHLVNHGVFRGHGGSSYASQPNPIYHDNGSGGFTDKNNVIEGSWQHFCGENAPRGCKGCKMDCPDAFGKEGNCSINFVDNWLYVRLMHESGLPTVSLAFFKVRNPRLHCEWLEQSRMHVHEITVLTLTGTPLCTCDTRRYKSTFKQHEQCSSAGAHVTGTVNVTQGNLPPQAQAVVDAAGPRV